MTTPVRAQTSRFGRLKNRRGAIAVMAALFAIPLLMLCAVAVDYSRLMFVRTQLRRAADAGALAGALQLMQQHDATYEAVANDFAARNRAFGAVVPNTHSVCGHWDDATSTMSDTTPCNPDPLHVPLADAVATTASANPGFLLAGRLFGGAGGTISVKSVAWGGGSLGTSKCMKPWAMPYAAILQRLGYPTDQATIDGHALTQEDVDNLIASSQANSLTFKVNGGQAHNSAGQPTEGNFYGVSLPPVQYADGSAGSPNQGAVNYAAAIGSCNNSIVSVGDWLQIENGDMTGPTGNPLAPLCGASPTAQYFDCNLKVKMAIWSQYNAAIGNPGAVLVKYIGAFVITHYDSRPDTPGNPNPLAGVTGYFTGWPSEGGFVNVPGPVMEIILVK